MKTTTLITATIIAPFFAVASINTESSSVSQNTIGQAKATGKYILVGNGTFGDRHVAGFLNKNFVMEESNNNAQTAYLIYNQDGVLVHRVVGDKKYPYELAVKIKRGLNANTQYYTLLTQFNSGERSNEILKNGIIGATDAQDTENSAKFMNAYLETLPAEPTAEQLRFVAKHTTKTSDPGFALLLNSEAATDKIAEIIFAEEFVSRVNEKNINIETLTQSVNAKYSSNIPTERFDRMAIELLEMREDWTSLKKILPAYLGKYQAQLSGEQTLFYTSLIKG